MAAEYDASFLGSVPWDDTVEAAVGRPEALAGTRAGEAARGIAREILSPSS
jgi:hypothetical protein